METETKDIPKIKKDNTEVPNKRTPLQTYIHNGGLFTIWIYSLCFAAAYFFGLISDDEFVHFFEIALILQSVVNPYGFITDPRSRLRKLEGCREKCLAILMTVVYPSIFYFICIRNLELAIGLLICTVYTYFIPFTLLLKLKSEKDSKVVIAPKEMVETAQTEQP